jgi:hypothetical protein
LIHEGENKTVHGFKGLRTIEAQQIHGVADWGLVKHITMIHTRELTTLYHSWWNV